MLRLSGVKTLKIDDTIDINSKLRFLKWSIVNNLKTVKDYTTLNELSMSTSKIDDLKIMIRKTNILQNYEKFRASESYNTL